ncbi:piggyBac transposable element-derived protein 4 [Pseudorasbora parva]|uniref:piggyBac transposable element-derived protein 4 n=1 Tax=Pseudorasbora parva TaxID=51549 RepID=UPI00351F760D
MEQGLPSAKAVSQHLMSGCLKSENEQQTDFIQSEIQVKVEPDQDDSLSNDGNDLETFPCSPGHVKEEIFDLGVQILPDGLMPPVEMEEELEIATNSHTSPDQPNRKTGSSSKRKKHTDKQRVTGKRKATNASSHTIRCPTKQILSIVHRNSEVSASIEENYESIAGPDLESEVSDSDGPECSSVPDVTEGQKTVLTDFELSSEESCDEESEDQLSRWSKADSYWSKYPPQSDTRTFSESCQGPALGSLLVTPKDAWELFISENILDEILQCTNLGGLRTASAKGKVWQKVTKEELNAFIGLSLLIGLERNGDVPVRELFLDPLQNPLYRATMSVGRYQDLHGCLQFDNKKTRVLREASDHMAAFRNVWDLFLINCRKRFIPKDCVTVGEQLVPFQGKCKFLQHLPSLHTNYGIKIFWMCDAEVPYAIDAIIYTGRKSGEETKKNLAENTVLRLSSGLQQKGLNITMDSYFTSIHLAENLFEKNLTMVGTLNIKNPHVPPIMKPSKLRALHTSEFGYCGNVSMVSYVQKRKKAEILLSTLHNSKALNETSAKNKPEIFQYYNRTKGGVNNVLQMANNYACKRRSKRWPMLLWYNMLNIAIVNSFSIFNAQQPSFTGGGRNTQRMFIKELVKELVEPQIHRRREESHGLSKNTLEAMGRCGVPTSLSAVTSEIQVQNRRRKRCYYCRSARDRKVSSYCCECSKPVCREHSHIVVICYQCMR